MLTGSNPFLVSATEYNNIHRKASFGFEASEVFRSRSVSAIWRSPSSIPSGRPIARCANSKRMRAFAREIDGSEIKLLDVSSRYARLSPSAPCLKYSAAITRPMISRAGEAETKTGEVIAVHKRPTRPNTSRQTRSTLPRHLLRRSLTSQSPFQEAQEPICGRPTTPRIHSARNTFDSNNVRDTIHNAQVPSYPPCSRLRPAAYPGSRARCADYA